MQNLGLSSRRLICFIRLLILLPGNNFKSNGNKYLHSQDQENKFQMEKSHLKHTYEKKVICFVGNYMTFKQIGQLRMRADFYKAYSASPYF